MDEAVRRLDAAPARPLDLGILDLTADDGSRVVRAFLNIASFGIGGLTDRIVNTTPKWIGGRAAFFTGTLRAMFAYQNAPVRVLVDGQPFHEGPIFNVAIANGRFFGGGMKIAPEADPSDGQLDVVVLGDFGRAETVLLSPKIYQGRHAEHRKVHATRGALVEAEALNSSTRVLIDLDGETPGRLPIRARLALRSAGNPRVRPRGRGAQPTAASPTAATYTRLTRENRAKFDRSGTRFAPAESECRGLMISRNPCVAPLRGLQALRAHVGTSPPAPGNAP